MSVIKKPADLKAYISFVVLWAPDRFPKVGPFSGDPLADVTHAFDELNVGVSLLKNQVKDATQLERLRQILDAARSAYLEGERIKGAHLLQDFQDIVFPERFKEYEDKEKN